MKQKIKILIVLNIISYIVNFVFAFIWSYNKIALKEHWGLLGIWVLIPYVLLLATSFVLVTDYEYEYKIFKKEAICDWFIRLISFCIVFQEFNFKFLSTKYLVQQIILVILLLINLYLEYKMYKKVKNYNYKIENTEIENSISEDEKKNIKNIGKATTIGVSSIIIVSAFGFSISQTYDGGSIMEEIFPIILSISSFIWFLNVNFKKCMLFYLNKSIGKRIFVIDSIYAFLGYVINLISIFGVYEKSQSLKPYICLIGILFLYPTIRTNRKIGLKYKQISKLTSN